VTFPLFWAPKTHFRIGRHENKEKRLFYFGLLPFKIQEIENPKNPKIHFSYCTVNSPELLTTCELYNLEIFQLPLFTITSLGFLKVDTYYYFFKTSLLIIIDLGATKNKKWIYRYKDLSFHSLREFEAEF
jgi:hypothetical protein